MSACFHAARNWPRTHAGSSVFFCAVNGCQSPKSERGRMAIILRMLVWKSRGNDVGAELASRC